MKLVHTTVVDQASKPLVICTQVVEYSELHSSVTSTAAVFEDEDSGSQEEPRAGNNV
jgi:hypothetical protein